MRKAKRSNRLTAFALSFLMLFTMTPVTASAQGVRNDGTAGEIIAFEGIAEEIRWQSVEYGTAWEDLNLPKTLSATVEGEAAEVPVKWQADPTYDASAKGLYLLTAQLAEGFYATAELPYIAVVVRANVPEKQMFARSFGGGAQDIDPFLIGTAAQLAEIATLTNAGQLETMFLGTSSGTVYLNLWLDDKQEPPNHSPPQHILDLINTNIDILYQQNTVRMRTGNTLINAKFTYYDSFKQESCGYIPQMPFEDEYSQLVPYDD